MAEGGWLPWKEQKMDIRPTPDYKELAKPLRPPPHGLEWKKLDDGTWELRTKRFRKAEPSREEQDQRGATKEQGKEEGVHEDPAPEFLEHVVLPDDTLVGICLKYKVKDRELRRLNGFVGDHFRMCDVLIVPNRFSPEQQPIQGASGKEPMSRNDMMQVFRKDSQLGAEESRFYLESNGWELFKALAQWRAENRWEAEQWAEVNSIKPTSTTRRHTKQQEQRGQFPVVSGTRRPNSRERGNIEMRTRGEEARVPLLSEPYAPAPGATLF
ncbi:unnamed protein product [Ectocarpus sp. 12 AP-2014]